MVRFIFTILISLLPVGALAGGPGMLFNSGSGGGGSASYCASSTTCTATTPGECDTLCEDFSGSSYCIGSSGDQNCRAGWTLLIDNGGGSIDWTTTPAGTLICSDMGPYVATVTITNGALGILWAKAYATDKPVSFPQVYIKINSESIPDNNSVGLFGAIDSNDTAAPWAIALYQEGGSRYLRLLHSDSSVGVAGTTALSLDTWYRVTVTYNRTAGTASVKLNGTTEIDVSSGVTGSTPRKTFIGSYEYSASAVTYQIGNMSVDDDTEPGGCTP